MKILYITNVSKFKSNISFSRASINACHKLNWTFHSVSNRSESTPEQIAIDEKEYNITLKHVDIMRNPFSLKNIKAYRQMVELIKKEKYDIIHCNTPVGGLLGRLAGKKCKMKRVIYQAHGFHFYKGAPLLNWLCYYPAERLLARFTDVLITINNEDYILGQKFKLRKNGKVYYVPGVGIDYNKMDSINIDKDKKREEIGIPRDSIMLLSVGELNNNKNHELIIDAMSRLNDPKIHYAIAGSGDLVEYLKDKAAKLEMSDNIYFLGFRSDIYELCKAADIFCFPSMREGLSVALMEAMVCGLPCVVSKIRGNMDLIDDEKGGFLFAPNNPEKVAEAIAKIAEDKSLCENMGEYNKQKIKTFGIDVVSERMKSIYEEII